MRRRSLFWFCLLVLVACDSAPSGAEPGARGAEAALSSESELDELKQQPADAGPGVRAWNDGSVGICRGQGKACEDFIGTSAKSLPPGKYMLSAEFAVPKSAPPEGWQIHFELECITSAGKSSSTSNKSKTYDIRYSGDEHGYRLSPLWSIDSPHPGGTRTCKYRITAPHPDGDSTEWRGEWTLPAAD